MTGTPIKFDKSTLVEYHLLNRRVEFLKEQCMMTLHSRQRKPLKGWVAIVCSVAFLGASNYCNVQAFAEQSASHHDMHQAAAANHHHDEETPTPAQHHEDCSVSCCSAMQAVVTPRVEYRFAASPIWQFHPLVLESLWLASFLEPSRTASGLSPPAREPTPVTPFYRTTFASHAPPICLA